jgi:hypothetical protein
MEYRTLATVRRTVRTDARRFMGICQAWLVKRMILLYMKYT